MGISGTDKALMYAQLGVMRFGASRFGYHTPYAYCSINGTERRTNIRYGSLVVTDIVDEAPSRCAMVVDGFTPSVGHEIILRLGSQKNVERVFAGNALQVTQLYEGKEANIAFQISALDYTWLLDRRMVTAR